MCFASLDNSGRDEGQSRSDCGWRGGEVYIGGRGCARPAQCRLANNSSYELRKLLQNGPLKQGADCWEALRVLRGGISQCQSRTRQERSLVSKIPFVVVSGDLSLWVEIFRVKNSWVCKSLWEKVGCQVTERILAAGLSLAPVAWVGHHTYKDNVVHFTSTCKETSHSHTSYNTVNSVVLPLYECTKWVLPILVKMKPGRVSPD